MTGSVSKDTISKDRFTNSKLVALFQTLSKTEVKAFSKYLTGTSYKADNAIFQLFFFLKKHHPNFNESKVNTALVWQYCFDEKEVNKKKLLQLCTNMVKVLEDFLIKLQLEKSQPERDFLLLNAFKDRKLDNQFFQKAKEVRKKWEKNKPPGIEQLHNEYKLESLDSNYKETTDIDIIMNGMQKEINNLDVYYLAKRLHLSYILSVSKNYIANEEDKNEKNILNNLLALSNQSKYAEIPAIHLSNLIFKDILCGKFNNYSKIEELFQKTFKQYSQREQINILGFLTHYCIQNRLEGDKSAVEKLFDLTKWAVANKTYIKDGYISNNEFSNIVNIACTAKQYNWARDFITNYQIYLVDKIRDDIVASCIATCLLSEKKYEELLSHLVSVNFKNIIYSVNARCLQITAFVELGGKDEQFYNSTKSFEAVLLRNKHLLKERKQAYNKFIKYSKIIYNSSYVKKYDFTKLLKEINKTKNLFAKNWILRKMKEKEKRASC